MDDRMLTGIVFFGLSALFSSYGISTLVAANPHAARREGRLVARSLTRYRLGSAVLQQLRRRRLNSRGRV
jgi:hypothetical protein